MQGAEMTALKTLRSGFIYLFIAMIMLIAFPAFAPISIYVSYYGMIYAIIILTLILLAIAIVFLYAVFEKIRHGMRQLSEIDSRFRICYTGTTLILVGLVVLVLRTVVFVLSAEYSASSGLVLAMFYVGGITAFIGYVLTFGVGAFKLYGKYRNPLYVVAGIFFVLSIFLTFTGLLGLDAALTLVGLGGTAVGYVLMYTALGGTIKKLNTQS